jgi:hypothetical protein
MTTYITRVTETAIRKMYGKLTTNTSFRFIQENMFPPMYSELSTEFLFRYKKTILYNIFGTMCADTTRDISSIWTQ